MKLIVKPTYHNCFVKKGSLTFDANNTKESHYAYFYDNGFEEVFDVIEEEPVKKKTLSDVKKEVKNYNKNGKTKDK